MSSEKDSTQYIPIYDQPDTPSPVAYPPRAKPVKQPAPAADVKLWAQAIIFICGFTVVAAVAILAIKFLAWMWGAL